MGRVAGISRFGLPLCQRRFPLRSAASAGNGPWGSGCVQSARPRSREWNVLCSSRPVAAPYGYRELCTVMKYFHPPTGSGSRRNPLSDGHKLCLQERGLHPEEIRRLREPGLIDIGAHTCTHPMLSQLPAGEQRQEISRSKELLEEIVGNPVEAFSYPYGGRSDYNAGHSRLRPGSGFKRACSNFEGHVRGSNRPLSASSISRAELGRRHLRAALGKMVSCLTGPYEYCK